MLDFIEKYKFAIIGTVVFHVFVFVYTNFATVQRPFKLVEPVVEMTIPIEDIQLDPDLMKIQDLNQTGAANQEVYNVTSDANDTRDKSYENFSTQEIDKQVEANAKALEQQYFDEWASTHGGNTTKTGSMDVKDPNKEPVKTTPNNLDPKSIDNTGANSFAGDVMASFNLKDRKAHALEKPGYTCNSAGTVVIEIKVDKNGDVKDATYQPSGSSNATECMIQQSIKYAKRSRFNYSSAAPALQTGTITYKFVSK